MPRWRTSLVPAVLAVVLAACGGDAGTTPTTIDQMLPIVFRLSVNDSDKVLQIRPGDEVVARLPLTGIEDDGWVMTASPNPAILAGGDDMLFFPSETDEGGVAYHEFSFIAAGPGRTSVTLTHGFQRFSFTVQVTVRG